MSFVSSVVECGLFVESGSVLLVCVVGQSGYVVKQCPSLKKDYVEIFEWHYTSSVYSLFSDRVGLPLHNSPSSGCPS